MTLIKVEFKNRPGLYQGIHLEIRLAGTQIRFYEVNTRTKKEYCLKKETVMALLHNKSLPRLRVVRQALKGDKTIFDEIILDPRYTE